jgi:hypothetical protein
MWVRIPPSLNVRSRHVWKRPRTNGAAHFRCHHVGTNRSTGRAVKLRQRKHPGGGYGGRYDTPARMSIMSYAAANALTGRNKQSVVESSTAVVQRTDVADKSS